MSEKKGPFDDFMVAANEALISAEQFAGSMIPLLRVTTKLGGISIAIRVLEAAGKVDKGALLTLGANAVCIADYYCQGDELKELEARFKRGEADLKIIIEALPEKRKSIDKEK